MRSTANPYLGETLARAEGDAVGRLENPSHGPSDAATAITAPIATTAGKGPRSLAVVDGVDDGRELITQRHESIDRNAESFDHCRRDRQGFLSQRRTCL